MRAFALEVVENTGFGRHGLLGELSPVLQEIRESSPLEWGEGLNVGRLQGGQEGDGLLDHGHVGNSGNC